MSIFKLAMYLLVTTLVMLNAQWTRISVNKEIQGAQVAIAMREVLYGLSLYSLTYWNNLTAAIPVAISYKNPVTNAQVNVVNNLSPTADELMMMGFLASPTATSTTYPGLPWGGAGSYATAIAITPEGCSGTACTTAVDVYWTQPVAVRNGKFDILLTSNVVNDGFIAIGYTYPDDPSLFKSTDTTWAYKVPAALPQQAGLAMLHTSQIRQLFADKYPAKVTTSWKTPVATIADLPIALQTNSISDIFVTKVNGVPNYWTGTSWNPLNTNLNNSTFLGLSSGNTGNSSVYIGVSSGKGFYVVK
jgi:hypothetical protein